MAAHIPRALTLLAGIVGVTTAQTLWPLQTYKSSSIETPYLNVTKMGQTEPGHLFISPHDILRGTGYPTIYSDDGQLVWQGQEGNYSALQPQKLNGESVIVYWEGFVAEGFGFGHISILNSSYDEIHRVTVDCKAENFVTSYGSEFFSSCIDIHESQLTDNGTILVTAVNVTQADLSSVGGPKDGWIQDGLVYEIDIKTNEILFRWSAYEHINELPMSNDIAPLGATGAGSGANQTDPWGYPHLNSIAKYGDSYLVSSRYMCSLFFLAPNGTITWHLHVCHSHPSTLRKLLTKISIGPHRWRLQIESRHQLLLPARCALRVTECRARDDWPPQQRQHRVHRKLIIDHGHGFGA